MCLNVGHLSKNCVEVNLLMSSMINKGVRSFTLPVHMIFRASDLFDKSTQVTTNLLSRDRVLLVIGSVISEDQSVTTQWDSG